MKQLFSRTTVLPWIWWTFLVPKWSVDGHQNSKGNVIKRVKGIVMATGCLCLWTTYSFFIIDYYIYTHIICIYAWIVRVLIHLLTWNFWNGQKFPTDVVSKVWKRQGLGVVHLRHGELNSRLTNTSDYQNDEHDENDMLAIISRPNWLLKLLYIYICEFGISHSNLTCLKHMGLIFML